MPVYCHMRIKEGVHISLAVIAPSWQAHPNPMFRSGITHFRNILQLVRPVLQIVSNDDYVGEHFKFPVAHNSSDGALAISVVHN